MSDTPRKPPSNDNQIEMYFHCGRCLADGIPPKLGVGWTPIGLQVWCEHHDVNIVHIDFEGRKHPANITAKAN